MGVPIPEGVEPFLTALRRRETYLGYAREALSLATCAARYPFGLGNPVVRTGRPSGDILHDTPVLLVHGFGHNRSGWFVLDQYLRDAGFTSVHTMNYDPFRHDVPELAEMLRDRVEELCAITGSAKVNVVGHSLGGILLRWYVQELGGDTRVDHAITVASPHEGTRLARPSRRSRIAGELAPNSWLQQRLHRSARLTTVKWTAFYSNLDLLVQPNGSAMIRHPALHATNVLVKDLGHLSIMLSTRVADGIIGALSASTISAAS
ncbi:MAG TPA: alpha/beta fold hydrolase [Acidimicrobiales bacterium]|nr:alpha/beta fold hydrolase [Acidimicrobiales bacterium]